MKKFVSVLLILAIACSLCACGGADKMEELCGVWVMPYEEDAETAKNLLESMEFYPEEMELIDTTGLELVMTVEFTQDKTYCYTYDLDACKANIRAFYEDAVITVYNSRSSLTDLYGYEIINMTEEEFKQFYAELFSMENYDALLDYFVENCLDYSMITNFDTGTFRLSGSKIICTATGSTQEEEMSYSISGDTLTLVYVDGKEVYTRG